MHKTKYRDWQNRTKMKNLGYLKCTGLPAERYIYLHYTTNIVIHE
jgi:hypothetical protein